MLQGSSDGNGVFIWLRAGGTDSLAGGPWPLLQRGDTMSPRGGTVGVRYMLNAVAHGLPLDSGAVEVRETAHVFTVVALGNERGRPAADLDDFTPGPEAAQVDEM